MLQDCEKEKAGFVEQYEEIQRKQAEVDEELKRCIEVEKQLREELELFKGKRDHLLVSPLHTAGVHDLIS